MTAIHRSNFWCPVLPNTTLISHTPCYASQCRFYRSIRNKKMQKLDQSIILFIRCLIVEIFFNQKLVSPPNNAYPYRAYIDTLLNYAPPALQSHLTAALWYVDTAGNMDAASTIARTASTANIGLLNRRYFTLGGKTIDLIGHLHCDVFNHPKFLLNGVEMRVRLVRSKDAFCLMDSSKIFFFSFFIINQYTQSVNINNKCKLYIFKRIMIRIFTQQ